MEKFDYSLMGIWDRWEKTLWLHIPLWKNWLPDEDSVDKVSRIIEEKEVVRKPCRAFERWRKLKEYWEQTEKVVYVEQKWDNYLSLRWEVFIVREEVKEEIERVFWEEIKDYIEFLDLKLVDLETQEEIIDIWKWYIINILKLIEWTWKDWFKYNWKMYDPILYKKELLYKDWKTKYPIYRIAERWWSCIISKEFKKVIDKFYGTEEGIVYFYRWLYYKEDLPCMENEKIREEREEVERNKNKVDLWADM